MQKKKNSRFDFVTRYNILSKSKHSQAAMEFLMTYGWAILAAIIAIGVLAYFGVFSPGKYISGSAAITAPFYINAWNVKASTGVTLEIRNNGGEYFNVTSVAISKSTVCDVVQTNGALTWDVPADTSLTVTIDCGAGALTEGDNLKGDITLKYKKAGSEVELTSTGTIADKVVA